jgi:WD40 repeat protein
MYLAVAAVSSATPSSGHNIGFNPHDASYPIRIYSVLSGDRVASLEGHQDLVYELSWSLDDDNLVSASSDGSVRIWMFLGDGSVRPSSVFLHPSYVYTAAFNPKAKSPRMVATGGYDGTIRLWEYDSYKKNGMGSQDIAECDLVGHKAAVNSVCFDAEGLKLYSGDADGIIKVWSLSRQKGTFDGSMDVLEKNKCIKTIHSLKVSSFSNKRAFL